MNPDGIAIALVVLSIGFMLVSGANDGGVLLALGMRYSVVPTGVLLLSLLSIIVVTPLLLGTVVAETLIGGVFESTGIHARTAFLMGSGVALALALSLSFLGLPTSLTIALIGGLSGASLGSGIPVLWPNFLKIVIVSIIAPIFGAILGYVITHISRLFSFRKARKNSLRNTHLFGLLAQYIAYSSNDGQKMLAVSVIAAGVLFKSEPGEVLADSGLLTVILIIGAAFFAIGTLLTLGKVSGHIGFELASLQSSDVVKAEFSSAFAVFTSSLVGAPVSMTQAVTAGIVGVATAKSRTRVRWGSVMKIGAAWFVTLPISMASAAIVASVFVPDI